MRGRKRSLCLPGRFLFLVFCFKQCFGLVERGSPSKSAQCSYLAPVARELVGRLQNHRQIRDARIRHDGLEGSQAERALSKLFMAVLVGAKRILRIVQMQRLQPIEANHPIELVENSVEVFRYRISRIVHMAGIETDAP